VSRGTENGFVFAAFGLRSRGRAGRSAGPSPGMWVRKYRFDEGYDAPRGGLACKLGAPSGGGLIA